MNVIDIFDKTIAWMNVIDVFDPNTRGQNRWCHRPKSHLIRHILLLLLGGLKQLVGFEQLGGLEQLNELEQRGGLEQLGGTEQRGALEQ